MHTSLHTEIERVFSNKSKAVDLHLETESKFSIFHQSSTKNETKKKELINKNCGQNCGQKP